MTVMLWIAGMILVLSACLGLVRIATARDEASRAAVSDLVYFCAVGIFVLLGTLASLSVLFDVAMIASLVGILATVALARIVTRGRR